VAVIIQDGMRRMLTEQEDVYYYITLMNENYPHPGMPEGAAEGIIKGMYLLESRADESRAEGSGLRGQKSKSKGKSTGSGLRVQLLGSGTILREVMAAADLLAEHFDVAADIWSCPSFTQLRRDGYDTERANRLNPGKTARKAYVTECLEGRAGPVIAATDYVRVHADQIRPFLPRGAHYTVLGTDGFGRSDTRAALRSFFEVDRNYIAHAAISALVAEGQLTAKDLTKAVKLFEIDVDKANPVGC
jgi:pyruvate dehydrogenase E1 component